MWPIYTDFQFWNFKNGFAISTLLYYILKICAFLYVISFLLDNVHFNLTYFVSMRFNKNCFRQSVINSKNISLFANRNSSLKFLESSFEISPTILFIIFQSMNKNNWIRIIHFGKFYIFEYYFVAKIMEWFFF